MLDSRASSENNVSVWNAAHICVKATRRFLVLARYLTWPHRLPVGDPRHQKPCKIYGKTGQRGTKRDCKELRAGV